MSGTTTTSPLTALRGLLAKHKIGYYIVPTADAHDSEYVAAVDQRRAFISGFNGSAGTAIIGLDYAEVATDSRYYLQAEAELNPGFTLRKLGYPGVKGWIEALTSRANAENADIGVDPRLISGATAAKIQSLLTSAKLVPISENLVDVVWSNQPEEPLDAVFELELGESTESKLAKVRAELRKENAQGIIFSALDDIAWLYNLRGSDVDYNPVFKSYAVVTLSSSKLYVDPRKARGLESNLELNKCTKFGTYDQVWSDLNVSGMWVPEGSSWAIEKAVESIALRNTSPVRLFKAVKNSVEIQGAKDAQVKCGTSIVQLLAWLDRTIDSSSISEYAASQKLIEFRKALPEFRGNSFESISSVGPNAAVIHYSPKQATAATIDRSNVYLLDSGCQFTHGTTDTTRTVHFGTPTPEEKQAYTLVLKGHIALAELVFPEGTTGQQLDAFARQFLWKYGLDYGHGTGHGVGAYLNVHEGPVGFGTGPIARKPLAAGNLVSNEPGFYKDGEFGIRIENLVLVQEAKTPFNFNSKKFYQLDTITLVPLALNMIEAGLLTAGEVEWINQYSQRVRRALSPRLSEQDAEWLKANTIDI